MKKMLSIVLAFLIVFSALPFYVVATEEFVSGDYTYTVNDDGTTATIIDYAGNATELEIPSELDGYTVTHIGDNAFFYGYYTKVIIPNSVISIGAQAFLACSYLNSVIIGDSVTSIGNGAFEDCDFLTKINIPQSVENIADDAFQYSSKLIAITVDENNLYYSSDENGILFDKNKETIVLYPIGKTETIYTIPNGIKTIGANAFRSSNLTEINMPDGVTSIGIGAFSFCRNLTQITIPESVSHISIDAFGECSNLKNIYYKGTEEQWSNIDIDNDYLNSNSYTLNEALIHFNYVEGTEHITEYSKTIAPTCVSKGYDEYTCTGCVDAVKTNWRDIRANEHTYTNNDGYCSLCGKCPFEYSVNHDGTTITITDYTASDENVKIPSKIDGYTVTNIGTEAFFSCYDLTNVTIPDTVTTIHSDAFRSCDNLENVVIGNRVTSVNESAFEDCYNLKQVTIPESLSYISYYAFYGCSSLENVYYKGTEEQWVNISVSSGNTYFKSSIVHFNYEEGTEHITEYLETVAPTCSKKGYDLYSCTGCTDGAKTNWKNTIDHIFSEDYCTECGTFVFECSYYMDYTAEIIKYLGSEVNVEIPSTIDGYTITNIGDGAFENYTKLESITMGTNITHVTAYAFYGCSNLKNVYYKGTEEQWLSTHVNSYLEKAIVHFNYEEGTEHITEYSETIAPTCNKKGYDLYTCTGCTNGAVTNWVEPTGNHNMENDYCIDCGTYLYTYYVNNGGTTATIDGYIGSDKEIEIPSEIDGYPVIGVGARAFADNTSLEKVTIPEGVTFIGSQAFSSCTNLIEIIIPNSVTSIGETAFIGCESLAKIDIPDNVKTIGYGLFAGCSSLTEIIIPGQVTLVDEYAFLQCTSLKEITIPNTVTSVSHFAFYSCNNLTDVYYLGTEKEWNTITIGDANENLTNANIHYIESDNIEVVHLKDQIRFDKNDDGTYAGTFDYRTVVEISNVAKHFDDIEDIIDTTDGDGILEAGFILNKGGAINLDLAMAQIQGGEKVYTHINDGYISTTSTMGEYVMACMVRDIPDADIGMTFSNVGYIIYMQDGETKYAMFANPHTTTFEGLYNNYYDLAFPA